MSEDEGDRVGYGRPPRHRQFQPGRSGNIKGRPKKPPAELDVLALLDDPVTVREGGEVKQMQPAEATALRMIAKALKGDRKALLYILGEFETQGLISPRIAGRREASVLTPPPDMPFAMGRIIAMRFGPPPWTSAQIAIGRAHYIRERSAEQAKIDDLIAYPALQESQAS